MTNWNQEASLLLKTELTRRGISHKVLVEKLADLGVIETVGAINNKLSRGTYKMAFFLQCMRAIGAKTVSVSVLDDK